MTVNVRKLILGFYKPDRPYPYQSFYFFILPIRSRMVKNAFWAHFEIKKLLEWTAYKFAEDNKFFLFIFVFFILGTV